MLVLCFFHITFRTYTALVAQTPPPDLLICAKDLFVSYKTLAGRADMACGDGLVTCHHRSGIAVSSIPVGERVT